MLEEATFTCAYCWSDNTISVDPTGGSEQQYVEDCQSCCRPNLLNIRLGEGESPEITAARGD